VSGSRAPHETAFLSFYDATFDEAYRYAARLCGADRSGAEDLVQDAYLAILRRFRVDGDRVLTIEYVVTTIRNRFLDRARSSQREERRLRLVHSADAGESSESSLPSQLASLSERDRTALVLRYVDDLPVPEVAVAMGLTVHATESLLVRARARLRGKEARDA
jgi:RNA polymerase sigma-70 factor (ECF subfamily)